MGFKSDFSLKAGVGADTGLRLRVPDDLLFAPGVVGGAAVIGNAMSTIPTVGGTGPGAYLQQQSSVLGFMQTIFGN
jgi:hypothetical protein